MCNFIVNRCFCVGNSKHSYKPYSLLLLILWVLILWLMEFAGEKTA